MKIIKTLYQYNKYLFIYCSILVGFVIGILVSIYTTTSTGFDGYYQVALFSVFCVLLGLPILLFCIFIIIIELLRMKKEVPGYFMKRKRKLTKKGKKSLKEDAWVLGLTLFCLSIGLLFTWFGVLTGINVIRDYTYLENPKIVRLYEWNIERTETYRSVAGSNNWLHGQDENGNEYSLRVGKHPDKVIKIDSSSIQVYFLPHSKIVMRVSK